MSQRLNHQGWRAQQLKVFFTTRDRIALEDLQRLAGLDSAADVIRLGLQRLADHYDINDSLKLFAFRKRRSPRKASAA